jgi:hypothetical protein
MKAQIKVAKWAIFGIILAIAASGARADEYSYVGTLASSEDVLETIFTLGVSSDVLLQTYAFGGGTNQKGTLIADGGTDPLVAIYSGVGATATILTDAMGNALASSLDLTDYDGSACPPAGAPSIGGSAQCGDVRLSIADLAAGTYTVLLSDGQYLPGAVFDNGVLGDSTNFADLTGGVFCNLEINGADCPNTTGAYALDITTTAKTSGGGGGGTSVPEPPTLLLLGLGALAAKLATRTER